MPRGGPIRRGFAPRARAAHCHVSAEQLCRLCPHEPGRTPLEHVTCIRIQRAQELLVSTEDKFEAIAPQVGYRSGELFTREFGRCVGLLPSQCRERASIRAGQSPRSP